MGHSKGSGVRRHAPLLGGVIGNEDNFFGGLSRMYLGRRKLAAMLNAANIENETVTLVPDVNPPQRAGDRAVGAKEAACVCETSQSR